MGVLFSWEETFIILFFQYVSFVLYVTKKPPTQMVLQSVSRDDSVGFCKKKNVNKQKPLLNRKLIKSFSYFSYDFWKK